LIANSRKVLGAQGRLATLALSNRQERTQEFFKGGLKFSEKYFAVTKVQATLFTMTFMSYMLFQF